MPRSTPVKLLVVAAALTLFACSNTTPTSPTTTPNLTTDTFTGTVTVNGGQSFSFNTVASGSVTVTLATLSPATAPDGTTAIEVGLALGTWNATLSTCQIVLTNDKATQGATVFGTASGAGALCARIFDVGKLTQNEDFILNVVHP